MSCWCEALCDASWLMPLRQLDPEQAAPVPGFGTLDSFRLVCGDPAVPRNQRQLPLPRESRAVAHGSLWHAVLAAHLCVQVVDLERWCVDPGSMKPSRSRLVAMDTGVPLAWLRPAPVPEDGEPAA